VAQDSEAGETQRGEPCGTVLAALARSKFRRRFRLGPAELAYLADRGLERVMHHARQLISERLAPAQPANDGRQTPLRGHPVFIAQHATATCCRGCLWKWHRIERGIALDAGAVDRVLRVIEAWLRREVGGSGRGETQPRHGQIQQLELFAADDF
jgi:hypothetical protein